MRGMAKKPRLGGSAARRTWRAWRPPFRRRRGRWHTRGRCLAACSVGDVNEMSNSTGIKHAKTRERLACNDPHCRPATTNNGCKRQLRGIKHPIQLRSGTTPDDFPSIRTSPSPAARINPGKKLSLKGCCLTKVIVITMLRAFSRSSAAARNSYGICAFRKFIDSSLSHCLCLNDTVIQILGSCWVMEDDELTYWAMALGTLPQGRGVPDSWGRQRLAAVNC